ncbi:transferase family protein [Salix suchowensis]|nr:transferase family protein [Salix suchowensis]
MLKSPELPDCFYQNQPSLICPSSPTPKHSLYLSNLDDQKFLRFSIKYLYLFKKSTSLDILKYSLSKVLVHYYPLAGRLRASTEADQKLEIDCNGEGAVFAEAFMDITAEEFLELSQKPNKSWRKLMYKVEAQSFLDIPPLVVQVTSLRCGGMIVCTAINHCACDGIGTSHFTHPEYVRNATRENGHLDINHFLQSQPLVPTSLTFTSSHIIHLKRQCVPSLKCTAFEALASHTWRSWVRALDLSPSLNVKLLFSVNVRKRLIPEIPQGYYGNGFVLGCAQTRAQDLVARNMSHGVRSVQQAKSCLTDDYVRSMIDLLEDKSVKTDLSTSLVISQWSKLGLEDVDFGDGKPLHMGPLTSDIYCLFLPVIGDFEAVRVQVSMPESVHEKFEHYMKECLGAEASGRDDSIGYRAQENGFC